MEVAKCVMMASSSLSRRGVAFVVCLLLFAGGGVIAQRSRTTTKGPSDECALFKADDSEALTTGQSTYLELGETDVSESFSLSMEVFPSTLNHNGILFSIGSRPNFQYYEWKDAAIHNQFLVVEFIFSALALTIKSLGTQHLHQIEIFKTYPVPYSIDDARWHTVRVFRDNDVWTVQLDRLNKTEVVTNRTDVRLTGKPAFIGGRPEYTDHQFQGAIKRLYVNSRPISLSSRKVNGKVTVWHCTAPDVGMFTQFIRLQQRHNRN